MKYEKSQDYFICSVKYWTRQDFFIYIYIVDYEKSQDYFIYRVDYEKSQDFFIYSVEYEKSQERLVLVLMMSWCSPPWILMMSRMTAIWTHTRPLIIITKPELGVRHAKAIQMFAAHSQNTLFSGNVKGDKFWP